MFDSMSQTEKKGFVEQVKALLNKLLEWVNNLLNGYKSNSDEAVILRSYEAELQELSKMWDEMLTKSVETNKALEVSKSTKTETSDKSGEDVLVQYDDREGDTKNAEELTEDDLRYLLENVQNGIYDNDTYLPLRISTPEFFIDVVRVHSEGKYNVMHVPMASRVKHLRQNMDEEDGASYGNERPHNLSPDDIVTISKEMGHPAYIVLQENGRYAMVVSFYNGNNKKVLVSIDFARDEDPTQNYKYNQYMNGYNEGYYNIVVTQYSPDDFQKYLRDNEVVYDKKKMNGRYQVGSGRIVTFTHDTPFIDNSILDSDEKVKENFFDVQNSDRDTEGRTLSEAQMKYFKDSKVRDYEGNLLPVYHGTKEEFTIFEPYYSYESSRHGGLNWAAKDYEYAKDYSWSDEPIVLKGYLNITKMLDIGDIDSYTDYQKTLQELANIVQLTTDELEEMVDFRNARIYDITSSKKFKERIVELGYDGVMAWESGLVTYGFVDSNQFKNIDNTNPTSSEDIRYQDRNTTSIYDIMGENEKLRKTNELLKADVERLKELVKLERKLTHGKVFKGVSLDAVARHLINKANSTIDMQTIGNNEYILQNLSLEDLQTLDGIVRTIANVVSQIDQFHVAKYNEGVRALGEASVKEINSRKKIYKDDTEEGKKHFEIMNTKVAWNNTLPYYAFKHLGETGQLMLCS